MTNIIDFPKPVEGLLISCDENGLMEIKQGNNTITLKDNEIMWFSNEVIQFVPKVELSMLVAGLVLLLGAGIHHQESQDNQSGELEEDVNDYYYQFSNLLSHGIL